MATRKQKENLRRKRFLREKKLKGKGAPRFKTKSKQKPWKATKMKMFNVPSPFKPEVSKKTIRKIVRETGLNAEKDFQKKYPGLADWFEQYDSLYLLSFCSVYFASYEAGTDPEIDGDYFSHHLLELLQALSLTKQRKISAAPLQDKAKELREDLQEVGSLIVTRRFSEIPESASEKEMESLRIRNEMMTHTLAVRNWAYTHQMKEVLLELSDRVGTSFQQEYGIHPRAFFEKILELIEERNEKLSNHINGLRKVAQKRRAGYKEMLQEFFDIFPKTRKLSDDECEEMWSTAGKDKKNLMTMLVLFCDLSLSDIYSFTIQEACAEMSEADTKSFKEMMQKLSYEFGDLEKSNKEHFILNNPVWTKPFIKIEDDKFFSAVWGVLPHFLLTIFEGLTEKQETLSNKYKKIKAEYLEEKVENLFLKHFPNATIYKNVTWTNKNGKELENDLLVILDTFILVVESKSGYITDFAKRGAPESMSKIFIRLIVEPSNQALALIHEGQKRKIIKIKTKEEGEVEIDFEKTPYALPLGVTLSQFGSLGSNLRKLSESGLINQEIDKLAPSISVSDLEIILELLDNEALFLHYLARRREVEAHLEYHGDELDLLGMYLDTGFNFGDVEYSRESAFNFGLKSKELDPYFIGMNEGMNVEKPSLKLTPWWNDMIQRISEKRFPGWTEKVFILMNCDYESQEKFEKAYRKLQSRIRRGTVDKPHNWAVLKSGPSRREYFLSVYPYQEEDVSQRNEIISDILKDIDENTRGSLVVAINIDRDDYPYSALGGSLKSNLFDKLKL